MLGGSLNLFISQPAVAADETGSWVDKNTIKLDGVSDSFTNPTVQTVGSLGERILLKSVKGAADPAYPIIGVIFPKEADLCSTKEAEIATTTGGTITLRSVGLTNTRPDSTGTDCTPGGGPEDPGDPEDPGEEIDDCQIDGIGWIVCPIATFIGSLTDGAYASIEKLLVFRISEDPWSTDPAVNPTYTIWSNLRNIANLSFGVAIFIVIFSQATNFGISAYGIRKMLPRIIVSAVLVNLSYYICLLAIDLSNVIGAGLDGLIMSVPLTNVPADGDGTWEKILSTVLAGGAIIGTTILAMNYALGLLLPFLAFALVSVFTAAAVLIARNALLIMAVILSPLAFVAYILPNTEGVFDKWRKLFTTLLVMYPLVAILFAGSKVASQVIRVAAPDSALMQIVSLVILSFPLFGVPWIVKFSGGLLGRVAGMVNDRSKGLVDRSRNLGKEHDARRRSELGFKAKRGIRKLGAPLAKRTAGWGYDEEGKKKKGVRGWASRRAGGAGSYLSRVGYGKMESEDRKRALAEQLAEDRFKALSASTGEGDDKRPTVAAVDLARRSAGVAGNDPAAIRRMQARATDAVDKLDEQDVKSEKTLFYYKNTDPNGRVAAATAGMKEAIMAGDSVRARAMQEVLMNETGAKGVEELRGVYEELDKDTGKIYRYTEKNAEGVDEVKFSDVGKSIRSALLSNNIRAKDAALDAVGLKGVSVNAARAAADTYTKLDLNQIVSQHGGSFVDTAMARGMSATDAQAILSNPTTQSQLDVGKRAVLQHIVDSGGTANVTAQKLNQVRVAASEGKPVPAATSGGQSRSQPVMASYGEASLRDAGFVQGMVQNTFGGYSNMHDDDLTAVRRAMETHPSRTAEHDTILRDVAAEQTRRATAPSSSGGGSTPGGGPSPSGGSTPFSGNAP